MTKKVHYSVVNGSYLEQPDIEYISTTTSESLDTYNVEIKNIGVSEKNTGVFICNPKNFSYPTSVSSLNKYTGISGNIIDLTEYGTNNSIKYDSTYDDRVVEPPIDKKTAYELDTPTQVTSDKNVVSLEPLVDAGMPSFSERLKIYFSFIKTLAIVLAFFVLCPKVGFGQTAGNESESTLETITVESPRPQWERTLSPGSMSIIVVDQFKGEQKDLASLLEHVPGLFVHRVTGEGQYTVVKIRGSSGAQVNVYVDGVLQNLGNDIAVDISLIPVSQVARIEVYRGYVPARFAGSPIGGVINIVTKKPEGLGVDASVSYASLNTKNVTLTATAPTFWNGALLVGAHYDQSDGDFDYTWRQLQDYDAIVDPIEEKKRKHNSHRNIDLLLKWQNENFSLKAAKKATKRGLPYRVNRIDYNTWREQRVDHTDVVLGYRNNNWSIVDFGIQLHYLLQDKRFERKNVSESYGINFSIPGGNWDYRKTKRLGGQVDVGLKLGSRNLLEFHADYSEENLTVEANFWESWSFDAGAMLPYRDYRLFPKYKERRVHIQLQDTLTFGPSDDMKLTVIARSDRVQSQGNIRSDNKFMQTWGIAFQKELNENVTMRFTAGTFTRYPNFAERFGDGFYILPTYLNINSRFFPTPTWEQGEQWDFGFDLHGRLLGASAYSSVSYFKRFTENMLSMHTNAAFAFYRNMGQGTVKGIEFEGGMYWPSFDLDASFAWQYGAGNYVGRVINYTREEESEHITNLPRVQLLLRGSYRFPGDWFSVFGEFQYIGRLYKETVLITTGLNSRTTSWIMDSPLQIISLGANWKIKENLNLTVGINDLQNKRVRQYQYIDAGKIKYRDPVDYPMAGITFYATLAYSFDSGQVSVDTRQSNFASEVSGTSDFTEPGGPFYLAPKIIYSKIDTQLSGDMWTYGAGDTNGTYIPWEPLNCEGYPPYPMNEPCYIFPRGTSYGDPVLGGDLSLSKTSLGLAFGFDFYKNFKVPVRIELEGTLHFRQNIDYGSFYADHGDYDRMGYIDKEIATYHRFQSFQNLQIRTYNIFLNGFFDFHNNTKFTPYIGGGIGFTHFTTELMQDIYLYYDHVGYNQSSTSYELALKKFIFKERQWNFAWNLAIGVSYQITANTFVDVSYRYVDHGSIYLKPTLGKGFYPQIVGAGTPYEDVYYPFYSDNPGQNFEMTSQQVVLSFRMNL
ncbi:MAG: TonB-dependent receptor plug domain-containing protein [Deltaproteobacteria bacterium]|jgi:outer membrane receptor for ferrienterochelin and colicin/opacity protein-like surface antigen|nr:TonB-dependent receptor plug domain-containing protein [Deltaproteobacteria bacterium]